MNDTKRALTGITINISEYHYNLGEQTFEADRAEFMTKTQADELEEKLNLQI